MVNMYHSSKSTDKVPLKTFTNSRCQQQRVDVTKSLKKICKSKIKYTVHLLFLHTGVKCLNCTILEG